MKFLSKARKTLTMVIVCSMVIAFSGGFAGVYGVNSYKASDASILDSHIQELSGKIGVRLMGTPNEKAAAEYIKSELVKAGYDAQLQEYQLPDNRKTTVAGIKIAGKEYYGNYYFSSAIDTITNPVISDKTLLNPSETDLDCINNWNVQSGSVVLVNNSLFAKLETLSKAKADSDSSYTAVSAATYLNNAISSAQKGNAAALAIYEDSTKKQLSLKNVSGNTVPVFAFNTTVGELLTSGNQASAIDDVQRGPSWNVYAVKKATTGTPKAIIHITGHLDSVMGSPGATDNASAAAAVIELARLYRNVDTGSVELRFVAVGGEEGGLNGSKAYVDTLTDEEAAISINFNMDMLSTSWTDADTVSLDINPRKSGVFNIAAALIITGSKDLNWISGTDNVRWFQYGSSDHVSFYNKGIDAASMIRTTDEDDDIEPENHTADDSIDANYSKERLEECTNMVSKGIAMAIDKKFSKVVDYRVDSNTGELKIANLDDLINLYDEIEFTIEQNGATSTLSANANNNYTVSIPDGAELVSAKGSGTGTANVKGTFNKPVTERYSTGLVLNEAASIVIVEPLAYEKAKAREEISRYVDKKDYDEDEKEKIDKIVKDGKDEISGAKTADEIEKIKDSTKKKLDEILTTKEKSTIEGMSRIKLVARSKIVTLNGKKAIRITCHTREGVLQAKDFDGIEIFRSTKRYSGYGNKPIFVTGSEKYYNTKALKKGTRYYYKARAFMVINGEKVYTDYSLKAIRIFR